MARPAEDRVEKGVTREGNDPTPESAWIIATLVNRPSRGADGARLRLGGARCNWVGCVTTAFDDPSVFIELDSVE